jgi:tRNA G10  N-methylase Trm11
MSQSNVIRSISTDQTEILQNILHLHVPNGFDCDVTYGNGSFYKNIQKPNLMFDIDPQESGVVRACSTALPLLDGSISSAIFDPPFLTYVRSGRDGNGGMVMARRYAGYWHYNELEEHYRKTLQEMKRILCQKGILVFKCQDIIHNHKLHCTHFNVVLWATELGFRLKDLFILAANHRMPSPNRKGKQKHARIYHSYFLVLEN